MEVDYLKNKFRNRKVFLTGHTGFKGSWLLSLLNFLGANVKGYSLPPQHTRSLYNAIEGDTLCQSVLADIGDAQRLRREILDFNPDFVFHLAAQPLVRLSYEVPLETYSVNSQGTANVLDALRFLEKACVAVMITTDKVYANLETGRFYTEDDRLGGYDPYSASKACAELVIDSYRNSFFNAHTYAHHKKSVSVARAGNVIGGGDWSKDRIIPDIVRALSEDKPIVVRNPQSVRPWQHVLEPLFGYLILAAKQMDDPVNFATAFNFGPEKDDVLPVSQLVDTAIKCWGSGKVQIERNPNQVHEASLLHLDITKAKTLLGWSPKMGADQSIQETIAWYKQQLSDQHAIGAFTKQQINNYLT